MLTEKHAFAGQRSMLLQRSASADYFYYLRQVVELQPGALYRLRFHVRADARAADAMAVCIAARGE